MVNISQAIKLKLDQITNDGDTKHHKWLILNCLPKYLSQFTLSAQAQADILRKLNTREGCEIIASNIIKCAITFKSDEVMSHINNPKPKKLAIESDGKQVN